MGDIPSAASWIEDAERRAGDDPRIGKALQQIAASEAGCEAHTEPQVEKTAEGHGIVRLESIGRGGRT